MKISIILGKIPMNPHKSPNIAHFCWKKSPEIPQLRCYRRVSKRSPRAVPFDDDLDGNLDIDPDDITEAEFSGGIMGCQLYDPLLYI
jgi:hypothetical protein